MIPILNRFVMVDTRGQLVLADAKSQDIQHVLYTGGSYFGYQFSHDGRWLAVAQDAQVDIWNTQSGELDLELQPTVALGFSSRLEFSDDDTLLLFKAIVPAPDDIRRSANDTTLTPWLWDLEAERRNRTGILPEQRRAQPFFDLRTELLLSPNNKLIIAYPRSIGVTDFSNGSYEALSNLETDRFEFDPIDVWYSMHGRFAYFRSKDGSQYHQINTDTGTTHFIPLGRELNFADISRQSTLELSDTAQIIGDVNTLRSNSFLRLLLTDRYHPNESPVTVMLLDILDPVTVGDEQTAFLVYIFNEETGRGVIDVIRPSSIRNIALHPNRTHVAVRRSTEGSPIEIYDLRTGNLVTTFVTRYPDVTQNDLFEFNLMGNELLVGWGRYGVFTGEPLIESPRYHPGFESFVFSDDDRSIITINDNELWEWDIASGEPINRKTIRLHGELIATSEDATRYLTRLPFEGERVENGVVIIEEGETEEEDEEALFDAEDEDPDVVALLEEVVIPSVQIPNGIGVEIYDVTIGERRQVIFEQLPDRRIRQTIASPDWEHFIVVYDSNFYSPYFPGNEVAIYSIDEGLLWFYAGDDLPAPRYRRYGWSDNNTAFVLSGSRRTNDQPQRIYGLDYHPSGLPNCLVEAFPDDWMQWKDLWEQFNMQLRSDELGRLTQRLCESNLKDTEIVEAILFPSPTPTRPPIQPTSSRIAGLPSCLSAYFGHQAAEYAPQWRTLTEGLDDTQVAEVEEILCQGLQEGVNVPVPNTGGQRHTRLQVVSIDVVTGDRSVSGFAPLPVTEPRPLNPVLTEFREQYGFEPSNVRLSNNAELLAFRTPGNHIQVYRLIQPYQTYIDALQATRTALEANQPASVSLLATPTAPGLPLGGPRATLTPTITPTAPPRPQETSTFSESESVVTLCDDMQLYHIFDPPPDYSATGRLLTQGLVGDDITVYDPSTGRTRIEEGLVDAQFGQLSPSREWLFVYDSQIVVRKSDGTDPVVLYESFEQSVFPRNIYWLDGNTLRIVYDGYLPDVQQNSVVLQRNYNAESGEFSAPVTATPSVKVNDIFPRDIIPQPLNGPLEVLVIPFNAGHKEGLRYYLYNAETEEIVHFATVSDGGFLNISWSPSGEVMYYSYPDLSETYAYYPEQDEHYVTSGFRTGRWSRDGRYSAYWQLPDGNLNEMLENDELITKLEIWDSVTERTRAYCIPQSGTAEFDTLLTWSPDNRYLAFLIALPGDVVDEIPRLRALILDTQSGRVTELSRDISRIIIWSEPS